MCKLSKSNTRPPLHAHYAEKHFEIIHSDVWVVSPAPSHFKYKYFVMFANDFSHFTWIFSSFKSWFFLQFLRNFFPKLKTNFTPSLRSYAETPVGSIFLILFWNFCNKMLSYLSVYVFIRLNKMASQNTKISIYLMLCVSCFLMCLYPSPILGWGFFQICLSHQLSSFSNSWAWVSPFLSLSYTSWLYIWLCMLCSSSTS